MRMSYGTFHWIFFFFEIRRAKMLYVFLAQRSIDDCWWVTMRLQIWSSQWTEKFVLEKRRRSCILSMHIIRNHSSLLMCNQKIRWIMWTHIRHRAYSAFAVCMNLESDHHSCLSAYGKGYFPSHDTAQGELCWMNRCTHNRTLNTEHTTVGNVQWIWFSLCFCFDSTF